MEGTTTTTTWRWRNVRSQGPAPLGRSSHSVSVINQKLYVYGGEDVPRHAFDTHVHVFDLLEHCWALPQSSEEKGDAPEARLAHTASAIGNKLWIIGGRDNSKQDLQDVYTYDIETRVWAKQNVTGDAFPPLSYHAAAVSGHFIYVFGGCSGHDRSAVLYRLDTQKLEWNIMRPHNTTLPCPRGGPGLCVIEGNVYVYAGYSGKHELDDLWVFDVSKSTWTQLSPSSVPPPRSVHCVAAVGNKLVTFGGESSPSAQGHEGAGKYLNDAWSFDVSTQTWTCIHPVHLPGELRAAPEEPKGEREGEREGDNPPSARGWMLAASLEHTQGIAVFGGFDGTDRLNDLHLLLQV